jgi:alanine racemase
MADDLSPQELGLARPIWAEVDLEAISRNLSEIKRLTGRPVKIIASVKGDAYGLGVTAVGRHLEKLGVNALATANFEDAVALRRSGVEIPIIMFASNLPGGAATLLKYKLTPSVCDLQTAQILSATARRRVNIHVKVDAGFGRLGVKLRDARKFIQDVVQLPNINLEGVYTHIPFSDEIGETWSRRRLAAFIDLIEQLRSVDGLQLDYTQACASAAIACGFPDTLNAVAPGQLLYGIRPVQQKRVRDWRFSPALTSIKARVFHLAQHEVADDLLAAQGECTLPIATRTGVILFGVDNGFRMPAVPGAYMLCRGKRCAVVGVSAEYTVIDLTTTNGVCVGDEVTIIGRDGEECITLEHVAEYLGLAPLYAGMSLHRIPMRYRESNLTE